MDADIVVVGAGLVGAAFALAASRLGLRVELVSNTGPPAPVVGDLGRVYALSPGSRSLLESLGVWQRLDPGRIQEVTAMQVSGDRAASVDFDALEGGASALAWMVESDAVAWALAQQLEVEAQVRCRWRTSPAALKLDPDAAQLALQDGSVSRAALVVGADGRESWVRTEAGIEVTGRAYAHHAVVANFLTDLGHGGVARQWFGAEGVLALLPLPGNQVSMVWSAPDAVAANLVALDADALCERVARAADRCLGGLRLVTRPSSVPIILGRAKRMVRPRLALIGDAAHNLHPLAGQGVNLGLRDVAALVRILGGGPDTEPGAISALRRFERSRSEDIATMILLTDGLQRLFSSRLPGIAWARNHGLGLLARLPHLKGLLLQQALR